MMIVLQKRVFRFLLALYVIAAFRPFFPYLEYALNKNFIMQQLCENRTRPELNCEGRCYLNKRLAKTEEPRPPVPAPVPQKSNSEWDALHLRLSDIAIAYVEFVHSLPRHENSPAPKTNFSTEIFHPPRLLAV